eukprot:TRINITY_DN114067_c0_g1_i1.p3 TRINITY_DN114067_c0_g1~~TRINITY_DN114067_c0_g1_i1.p3  ORF type:complete len:105 (-),score=16.95 TRINITY_DN114067_c0_g1_i1:3-317(-)
MNNNNNKNTKNCVFELKNLSEGENLWVDKQKVSPTKNCRQQANYFDMQSSSCLIIQRVIECQQYGPKKMASNVQYEKKNQKKKKITILIKHKIIQNKKNDRRSG